MCGITSVKALARLVLPVPEAAAIIYIIPGTWFIMYLWNILVDIKLLGFFMQQAIVQKIFKHLSATITNPTTELQYTSNFELLVAVMLSARTTDKNVNKATAALFKAANTPEKIGKLGENKLKQYIKSIGFYNAKAKNVINTCKILGEKFNSQVPNTREALESLPGVGRKTANVLLNIAFKQPTIAVDTHVFRVANRTGLASGKTPAEIETQLTKIIPPAYAKTAGNLLLLHGRYTCKAAKPLCPQCVINQFCEYKNKTPSAFGIARPFGALVCYTQRNPGLAKRRPQKTRT
jgi:endonuclease-3